MKKSTFLILCLGGSVLSFNVVATAALVPSIARTFSVSEFLAGRAVWFYMLPYGLAALFYGPLVRCLDAKKIELTCLLFFSLANLAVAFSRDINMLLAGRFFMGLFGAAIIPLGLILISRHVSAKQRGKLVGLFFGSTFIAALIGLFLSSVLNWRMIYLIPSIAGFLLLIFMYLYLPSFSKDTGVFKVNYIAVLKDKTVLAMFTYIFAVSFIYHGVQQWLGVYFFKEYNLGQFFISMLIMLTSLSGIFGEVWGGRLSDTLGRAKTVNIGIALMILAVLALVIKPLVFLLVLIMVVWGLGWTINHAGLCTALTDLPEKFVNESASLNSSVRFISGGVGAAVAGVVMQRSFSLGLSIFCAGLIILLLANRRLLRFQAERSSDG